MLDPHHGHQTVAKDVSGTERKPTGVELIGTTAGETADTIMYLVVLTDALSSLNAGLYSTGRILHSVSMAGSAPKFAGSLPGE